MAETTTSAPKTPWHLWLVGVLSLLWNAVGALDFFMTQTHNEAYMKAFTPEQLTYFYGFPFWVVITWGIGTWGSTLGSLTLLLRKAVTYPLLVVVYACMILTMLHNFVLTDGLKIMGGGVKGLVLPGVIMLIGLLLLFYARAMRRRGVLR